jgi:F-type H+-transporting ATPase subunit b
VNPHEAHGLPWKELLIPQFVNFTIFISLLVYFLRKPLADHFSGKNVEFEEMKKKAEQYKAHAEEKNHEVRAQLKELESSANSSLASAKAESQALKEKIISEAQSMAKKITEETGAMAHFELLRAVATLKQELVVNSTKMAEATLSGKANEQIQSKLNEDFINKIQVTK